MANNKGTQAFRDTIKAYLDRRAAEDEYFAFTYENPAKSIDECVDYIITTVKASGCHGFTDDEIYGMAVHYYDEEDPGKIQSGASAQCVVNHQVELTEEEKEEAKRAAVKRFEDEAYRKLQEAEKRAAEREKKAKEAMIAKAEEKRRQLEAEGLFSLFGED